MAFHFVGGGMSWVTFLDPPDTHLPITYLHIRQIFGIFGALWCLEKSIRVSKGRRGARGNGSFCCWGPLRWRAASVAAGGSHHHTRHKSRHQKNLGRIYIYKKESNMLPTQGPAYYRDGEFETGERLRMIGTRGMSSSRTPPSSRLVAAELNCIPPPQTENII